MIFISSVVLATGYMGTAWIRSLWQFHFFYGVLVAIGTGGATIPLVAAMMSKWFEKRRGLAISLALSGAFGRDLLSPGGGHVCRRRRTDDRSAALFSFDVGVGNLVAIHPGFSGQC